MKEPRAMRVFVSGPYTEGDPEENVKNAIFIGDALLNAGLYPYIPHFTHFWNILYEHPKSTWLTLDSQFLRICHAVVRIPGSSSAADEECALARDLGIPVFRSVRELLKWKAAIEVGGE